ncbi:MAG: autotransporter-associated beta strand repeat-containing protein [Thermoguttaceae bacterium]
MSAVLAGSNTNFTKAGGGLLVLNCANTYTGTTTIGSGMLAMRVTNALGGTATGSTVSSGGSLAIGNSSVGGAILNEALTINGGGYNGAGALCTDIWSSYNFAGTVNSLVTLGSNSKIVCDTDGTHGLNRTFGLSIGTVTTGTAGYALTVGGAGQTTIGKVWGSGSLTKEGSGTLMITGLTSHTGGTTISEGTLQLGNGTTTATMAGNIVNNSNWVVSTGTANFSYTGQLSGTGTLVKQGGAGMLRLGGTTSNTYTGLTTVSSGILQVEKSTALGSTSGSTNVANGASIYLNMNGGTISENVNLAGSGYSGKGALRNVTGTNTWAGTTRLTDGTHSTWITCVDGRLTISGNIVMDSVGYWSDDYGQLVFSDSGPGDEVVVTGNITGGTTAWSVSKTTGGTTGGTLTLAGNNSYLGSTEISRGVLRVQGGSAIPDASVVAFDRPSGVPAVLIVAESEEVGSLVSSSVVSTCNGTVQIDAGANLTIGGDNCTTRSRNYFGLITGSGSLTKAGVGRQILGGDNSGFTGDTSITEGTLTASIPTALGTGNIKVDGSNAVLETGSSLTTSGDVILSAGTIAHACVGSSGTTTVTGSGTVAACNYTLKKGVFGASLGGSGILTKTTSDTAALTCTSPGYAGKTVIDEGTLVITQDSSLGAAPDSVVSDQLTLDGGGLRFARGISSITLGNTGGTYSATAIPTATISGGGGVGASVAVSCGVNSTKFVKGREDSTLDGWVTLPDVVFATPDMPGGVPATGSVTYVMVGDTYTITGVTITNPGSGYTETPLMWVVNGSNSTGGQIWASVSSVKINGVVLPAGSGYGYTSAPTITFSSGSASATASLTSASTTLAANRGITLGDGGGTLETDSGFNAVIAGTISGSGALTKTGSGSLTLVAANTYTGNTTISAGTLQLGNGATNGSVVGDIAIGSGTLLVFNNASTQNYNGTISGSGYMLKKGAGSLVYTGSMSCGSLTVSAGKLQIGNGSTSGTVNMNITNNALVTFNNNNAQTYGYVIKGTGGLKKYNSGVLTLTGSNTFTGTTTVAAGTLRLSGSGSINSTGSITLDGGALMQDSSVALTRFITFTSSGTLGGTGAYTRSGLNVSIGSGHLSPGDGGIGTFTMNCGTVTLTANSVLDYDFGTTSGSCDLITVNGKLILDGTLNISCSCTVPGRSYVIFSGASSITDNGLVFGTVPANHNWSYSVVGGTVTVYAAPEPGTIVLLMIGLTGLAAYAWRKRKVASLRG